METIISTDGTQIAFDRHVGGDAGTVILIGGAFSHRRLPKMVELTEALANEHGLTVINYDRRGRGDSGDTPGVYDVEHEIDDLATLVEAVGGSASLFGWSSGAALALRAAASGRIPGVQRVVAFEPPFVVDREHHVPPAGVGEALHALVAADRRSETVRFFMTKAMGIPSVFVTLMRVLPIWSKLMATASSTPHDWAVMAEFMRGQSLRPGDWAGVTVPTLVLAGSKSDPLLRTAARAIADVLPNADHREVPKLSHDPDVQRLVPAAAEFLTGRGAPASGAIEAMVANTTKAVSAGEATAARISVVAGAAFAAILLGLHVLEPEFDPTWRFISEYALGSAGWLMSLAFLALATSLLGAGVAIFSQVRSVLGYLGLAVLGIGALGFVVAAMFTTDPITTSREAATFSGNMHVLGASLDYTPVAALALSFVLARMAHWRPIRRRLFITSGIAFVAMVAFILVLPVDGTFGPGVLAGLFGRLLVLSYLGWLLTVGVHVMHLRRIVAGPETVTPGRTPTAHRLPPDRSVPIDRLGGRTDASA